MEFLLYAIVFVALIAFVLWANRKGDNILRDNNFDSYMSRNGLTNSVRCFKCNGTQIGVTNGHNNSQRRTHYCRSCGTNLFYSSET